MFDTICNLPLTSDLFSLAIHPKEPLLAVGLASGHVEALRLPAVAGSPVSASSSSENGVGHVDSAWRTRRHKESCRSLAFSSDGEQLYSAGADGLVKAAMTETGKVVGKIAVPLNSSTDEIDAPTLLRVLSPQTLLLATDSSALHIYDLRASSPFTTPRPQQTHRPHEDYISSLTPLPPSAASTSGFSKQWVTTGGTTLAVTDLRRGVMVRSEDQEEELLSSTMVTGWYTKGNATGEKLLVGDGSGVVTLWDRGVWDDQDERIIIDRGVGGGESVDAIAQLPEGVGPGGKVVAVGLGNGLVRFVNLGPNKIIDSLSHDEQGEGVVALDFDVGGRMISGGGQSLKVWHEKLEADSEDEEDEVLEDAELDDDADTSPVEDVAAVKKRALNGSDDDSGKGEESSEEETSRKRRKKKRRNKGKVPNGGGKSVTAAFKGLD
ncbi:WD40 repeat-like protein [Aulographum hederae CBS 113979]|uniref:WD repeat-containing protein JIP5 n=1 Tax=Aulographum hederae CBS 113979 TaxID=1176131 RepID=A0A6G1HB67_9PEZI|nr:WD40 repeat-like protein [Aulographum hederae CBS 113979]